MSSSPTPPAAYRVLHVLPFTGMGGGAPRAALTLIAEQAKHRPAWVVSLVDDDFAAEARKTGAQVICVFGKELPKSRMMRWIRTINTIRAAARSQKADLIHCHSAPGNRYCYPASRLAGVPLVTHQRDTYKPDHFHAWVHRTDRIIAISAWARNNLPAALHEKVTVVYDAVAIPEISAVVWPHAEGRLLVGMAGRCVPEKGLDLLIDAVKQCAEVADFGVEIWGFQPRGPGTFADTMLERIRSAGLASRFTLEGYRLDMENFYRRIDIAVVPSRVTEGFGLTAAEAQAWGKAVIVAGHAGLAEIVEPEKTGLQFVPQDAGSLAQQLRRMLLDAPLRCQVAKAGRESAAARFGAALHAERVDAVYRQVLGR